MRALSLVLVVLALAAPLVAGQGSLIPHPTTPLEYITGDVVWDTPHDLDHGIVVTPNSTLTVRGTSVDFHNATLEVNATARMIVESTDESPALLHGDIGWSSKIVGELTLVGTEANPVDVVGLGGVGNAQNLPHGGPVTVLSSMEVPRGTINASHARFLNYTGGVLVSGNPLGQGHVTLRNVTFDSPFGAGLVVTNAYAEIRDSSFRGMGGNVFLSSSNQTATLTNVTFEGSTAGFAVRAIHVVADGIYNANSTSCLTVEQGFGLDLDVRNFACVNPRQQGIYADQVGAALRGASPMRLENATISTSAPRALAMILGGSENLTFDFTNVSIGPTGTSADAVELKSRLVDLTGVRFHDVGGYDVAVVDPAVPDPTSPIGEGDPGNLGWLHVVQPTTVLAANADGRQIENNADLVVYDETTNATVFKGSTGTTGAAMALDRLRLGADLVPRNVTYDLKASLNGTTGEHAHYVPATAGTIVRLNNGTTGDAAPTATTTTTPAGAAGSANTTESAARGIPFPTWLVLAAACAGALAWRRRL